MSEDWLIPLIVVIITIVPRPTNCGYTILIGLEPVFGGLGWYHWHFVLKYTRGLISAGASLSVS